MTATSEPFERLGWSQRELMHHMDALPLVDDLLTEDQKAASFHRMHWISAAIAITLFVLARLDLLPTMPW